jgi:hypothetical protein
LEQDQRWAVAAGINPYGLSAKTTRKTLESWMITAGIIESAVCLRQGHDSLTSMKHYQGFVFSEIPLIVFSVLPLASALVSSSTCIVSSLSSMINSLKELCKVFVG